jgi:hypothetical protein
MKPSECPARDWSLYYNGTYMWHPEHGVVGVQVNEEQDGFEVRHGRTYSSVAADTLTPLWPEAQAINLPMYNTAAYIGRRARREARRSCTNHHYNVLWTLGRSLVIDRSVMYLLAEPPELPTLPEAIEMLTGDMSSVAISHDLIIYPQGDNMSLVCRGTEVGRLVLRDNVFSYEPEIPNSPLARRVQFKLDKESILCHLV